MGIVSSFAVYFIIWWTVLFAVLPFGVRHHDPKDVAIGTDHGAPVDSMMIRKVVITTLIAAVVFAGVYVFFEVFGMTLEDLMI